MNLLKVIGSLKEKIHQDHIQLAFLLASMQVTKNQNTKFPTLLWLDLATHPRWQKMSNMYEMKWMRTLMLLCEHDNSTDRWGSLSIGQLQMNMSCLSLYWRQVVARSYRAYSLNGRTKKEDRERKVRFPWEWEEPFMKLLVEIPAALWRHGDMEERPNRHWFC